jgi:hypothetical protein
MAAMTAWLDDFRASLESLTGTALTLTADEVEQLLALARDAAHDSGAKLNAPLACYLLGRAQGVSGRPLSELVA